MDSAFRIKFRILIPLVFVLCVLVWIFYASKGNLKSKKSEIQALKGLNEGKTAKIKNLEERLYNQITEKKKLSEKESELTKKDQELTKRERGIVDKETELTKRESELINKEKNVKSETSETVKAKETKMISFGGERLVHLDLKGGAPKMDYLLQLIPTTKQWGATGFLIEYEDTFPYDGDLSVLKSPYAYKLSEITDMLEKMKAQEMLVVPLVQTFGHMEFVLKHKKFAQYRHIANMTNALNASNKGSFSLVKSMLEQIIKVHKPYMKYFHIGGDEVWTLHYEANPNDVYMKFMTPIIDYVIANEFTPIIWDDMMREWTVDELKGMSSKRVQPMVWAYPAELASTSYQHFPEGMWKRYGEAFEKIWFASAFKGADRPYTDFVTINDRIKNHLSWLKIFSELESSKMKILGIALTGWSRFDHDGTLCELLPASLPSLAMCLAVLQEGQLARAAVVRVSKELGFRDSIVMHHYFIPGNLSFPDEGTFLGHSVFGVVLRLRKAQNALESVDVRLRGWFNDRQAATTTINVYHFDTCVKRTDRAIGRLNELKRVAPKILSVFYTDNIVDEWVWDKISSLQRKTLELKRRLDTLKKTNDDKEKSNKNG